MLLCADSAGLVHGTCRIFWLCALHVIRVLHIYCRKLGKKKGKRKRIWDFSGSPVGKTLPSDAGDMDSIVSQGAEISQALRPQHQNMKQKQCCNKFNKDFKNLKKKMKEPFIFPSPLTVSCETCWPLLGPHIELISFTPYCFNCLFWLRAFNSP